MDIEKFEEIEAKILEIAERVGVVKTQWVAKELNIRARQNILNIVGQK